MLVFNAIALYWIGGWQSDDTFLKLGGVATIIVHPLFFLLPIVVFYLSKKYLSLGFALITFPFIWTGFEYSHNNGQLAFPWLELGNTETYNLNRIQFIDITGVHGLTFLICIAASLLFFICSKLVNKEWTLRNIKSVISLLILFGLLIAPNFYSYNFLTSQQAKDFVKGNDDKIKVTAIQPNVDPHRKWLGSVDSLINSYIQKLNDAATTNPDLIVLHETTTPYYFFEPFYDYNTSKFLNFVKEKRQNLLIGIPHLEYYADSNSAPSDSRMMKESGRRYDTYNSAVLLEPDKRYGNFTIHKKVKLVPISERVPYQEKLPFIKDMVKWGVGLSSWQMGDSLILFTLQRPNQQKVSFATLICFESVFSEYVSEGVKNGAEFLVVITNDGWFGNSSGPVQHNQYAVLRAIENRKWVVRCAQTGISCFIDPLGNQFENAWVGEEKNLSFAINSSSKKTFYSVNGDVIGKVSWYVMMFVLAVSLIAYAYKRKARRNA